MERYAARSGNAGVRSFEVRGKAIVVEFNDGRRYLYNALRPGVRHVKEMVRLAHAGLGLTTYINQHVRENYAERLDH
jgi:hypothetical protein